MNSMEKVTVKGFVCCDDNVHEFEGEAKVMGDTIVIRTDGIEIEEGDVVTMVMR